MRHPFHRVHLWTLLILIIQCVSFYLFRRRLTNGIVSLIVPPFPADWQYHELIPASLWLFAGFNTWAFSKLHGWRTKSEPSKEKEDLLAMLKLVNPNMESLNENVWNLFRTFNPLIEQYGVRWELDEMKLIKLREIAHTIDVKGKMLEEKKRELKDLENIEVTA